MYTSRLQKFNIIDRGLNQIDKIRMGWTSKCEQTSIVNNLVRKFNLEKLIDNIDIIINYYNGDFSKQLIFMEITFNNGNTFLIDPDDDFSKVMNNLYKYLKCLNAAFYE